MKEVTAYKKLYMCLICVVCFSIKVLCEPVAGACLSEHYVATCLCVSDTHWDLMS